MVARRTLGPGRCSTFDLSPGGPPWSGHVEGKPRLHGGLVRSANSGDDRGAGTVHLADPPVVLTRDAGTLVPRLLVGRLIEGQHPTLGQPRLGHHLLLDLPGDRLRRPRRVRHEVLQVQADDVGRASDVGKGALAFHAQQPAQVGIGVRRAIPRVGAEATAEAPPVTRQTLGQPRDRVRTQAPTLSIRPFILTGRNRYIPYLLRPTLRSRKLSTYQACTRNVKLSK
jgi:hypothetical protein